MRKIVLAIFCTTLFVSWAQAQGTNPSRTFSPYSGKGIGLLSEDFYAWNFGMANVGLAHYDQNVANMKNPALLSFNKTTVMDVTLGYRNETLALDTFVRNQTGVNFNSVNLVMPVSYRWTTAVSLTPVSRAAIGSSSTYDIQGSTVLLEQTDTTYGSLQKVSWSNGVRLSKNLRLGAALSYTFGTLVSRTSTSMESGGTYLIDERTDRKIQGLEYQLGAYYQNQFTYALADPDFVPEKDTIVYLRSGEKKWKYSEKRRAKLEEENADFKADSVVVTTKESKDRKLQIGVGTVYGTPAIWEERNVRSITWFTQTASTFALDTSTVNPNGVGSLGVGFSVGNMSRKGRWTLAADLEMTNWSAYRLDGETSGLGDAMRTSIGFQYTPEIQSEKNFLWRTSYSLGAYQYNSPYLYDGEQLDEFGIHFGLSFVERERRSNQSMRWRGKSEEPTGVVTRYNVGMAVGKLGYNSGSAIQQTFLKVNFGVSLNSEWFLRRKIN